MKKRIILGVVAVIIVLLGVFLYTQINNIKGIMYFLKYSEEEIEQMMVDNSDRLKSDIEDVLGYTMRDFTEEELKRISDGTATKDDIIKELIYEELQKMIMAEAEKVVSGEKTTVESVENVTDKKAVDNKLASLNKSVKAHDNSTKDGANKSAPTKTDVKKTSEIKTKAQQDTSNVAEKVDVASNDTANKTKNDNKSNADAGKTEVVSKNKNPKITEKQKANEKPSVHEKTNSQDTDTQKEDTAGGSSKSSTEYILQLYNVRSEYTGILSNMVGEAIAQYKALDAKERTHSKQLEIGSQYASKAAGLEAACDAEVEALLSQIEAALISEGKPTDIIGTIRQTYASEKQLSRAQYLNMFK